MHMEHVINASSGWEEAQWAHVKVISEKYFFYIEFLKRLPAVSHFALILLNTTELEPAVAFHWLIQVSGV